MTGCCENVLSFTCFELLSSTRWDGERSIPNFGHSVMTQFQARPSLVPAKTAPARNPRGFQLASHAAKWSLTHPSTYHSTSLWCIFLYCFSWLQSTVQRKNSRDPPIHEWLTGWITKGTYQSLHSRMLRRNCAVFEQRSSTFWIVCQQLIFIQMSIHSNRKHWLHLILFEERGGRLRSSMQEIIPSWLSKVRFNHSNAFIELSECHWNFIV